MLKLEKFKGKRILKSTLIDENNVVAFFTTRDLPLKVGERMDLESFVADNKKLVADGFEIPLEDLIIPEQTHSDNIGIVTTPDKFNDTDALVTDKKDFVLALNFADCVPLIFYDEVKKVVAVAHAGWRGTAQKIAKKTVLKMKEEFNSDTKDIIALIGPAIGKCCYEVSSEVMQELVNTIPESEKELVYDKMSDEKAKVDLKLINKFQILATGVSKIDLCEDCTSCKNELFFSYRKEQGHTARHSAVIKMI